MVMTIITKTYHQSLPCTRSTQFVP